MTPTRIQLEMTSPFRRRRYLSSHRRRGVWLLLLRTFAGALFTVALPLAALVWLLGAPQFRLQRPVVEGVGRVPAAWIHQALEPLRGRHLMWLSLPEVESRLTGHPWIRGVEIRKQLPDELRVQVIERRPAALLRRPEGLFYMDAEGVVIDRYDPLAGPSDLVILASPDGTLPAVARVLEIVSILETIEPAWGRGLSEIEILNDEDLRLFTAALPFPVILSGGRAEADLRKLRWVMPEIERIDPRPAAVDLRYTRQVVVQPAAEPPSRRG